MSIKNIDKNIIIIYIWRMSYQSEKRARLIARKATLEAQLTIAEATLTALLGTENKEYQFDDGEGSQRVKRRQMKEVRDTIENLEASLDSLCQKLAGRGLVATRLRRKKYNDSSGVQY